MYLASRKSKSAYWLTVKG